jgi:hypothetical protein
LPQQKLLRPKDGFTREKPRRVSDRGFLFAAFDSAQEHWETKNRWSRRLDTRSGLRYERVGFAASESLVEGSNMHYFIYDDPDLTDWLRWASESGETPSFIQAIAEAAFFADLRNYALLRPVLLELKRQSPRPVSSETPIRR